MFKSNCRQQKSGEADRSLLFEIVINSQRLFFVTLMRDGSNYRTKLLHSHSK